MKWSYKVYIRDKIMIIIYIDIVLLVILLSLTVFTCGYCFYRIHRMQQNGQISILLKPTKVLFSHKKEGENNEELRTVVAYQNPFTGDYCIHKSRVGPKCYVNAIQTPDSPDSGVSDEYEPLNLDSMEQEAEPQVKSLMNGIPNVLPTAEIKEKVIEENLSMSPKHDDNSVNKTWNWNYTEYQI